MYLIVSKVQEGGHNKFIRTSVSEYQTEAEVISFLMTQTSASISKLEIYEAKLKRVNMNLIFEDDVYL